MHYDPDAARLLLIAGSTPISSPRSNPPCIHLQGRAKPPERVEQDARRPSSPISEVWCPPRGPRSKPPPLRQILTDCCFRRHPQKKSRLKTPLPAHRASPPPPSKGSAWSESLGGPAPVSSSSPWQAAGHDGLAMNVLPQWPPRSTQPFRRPSRSASSTTRASRPRSGGGSTQRQYFSFLSFPDIPPPADVASEVSACGVRGAGQPATRPPTSLVDCSVLSGVATAWCHPSKTVLGMQMLDVSQAQDAMRGRETRVLDVHKERPRLPRLQ